MYETLQERIGYRFRCKDLLIQAMTHSSYANEHGSNRLDCNERLEFLGDAVLELTSSEFLFEKYPDYPEGELTKLRASIVCEPTLADVALSVGLRPCLRLGKGEEATGGRERPSITSDALEALIGAIYLDGGFASAKEFVRRFVMSDIENRKLFYDSKTILQEMVQESELPAPEYVLTGTSGPEHLRIFDVEVRVEGKCLGRGSGKSKKSAEQIAAYQAILKLRDPAASPESNEAVRRDPGCI